MKKSIILVGVIVPCVLFAQGVSFSASTSVMSKYIYRGMDQSTNNVSTKLGVNGCYKGIYAGATAQTIDFGTNDNFELDYYAGYTNTFGIVTYDLNYFVTNYDGSTDSFKEASVGLSAEVLEGVTFSAVYGKGIDNAPDNLNTKISYSTQVATFSLDYNDYETFGKATTLAMVKDFKVSDDVINVALKYTNFSSKNEFIKNNDYLYLEAKFSF
jgi:hypothetical protein